MTNKEKYQKFCIDENISIFSQAWWLDAVCMDNWDVVLVENNGDIIAAMPYYYKKKGFFKLITMPKLTQNMGPYIKYPQNQKYGKKIAYEKEVMSQLIDKLPEFDMFSQNFNYNITNWLPFYWKGFQETTRYTYIIDDLNDLDIIFSNFDYSKRKNIMKAEKFVNVIFDISAEEFYVHHKKTLRKQGSNILYDLDLFKRIYNAGYLNNSSRTIAAYDKENNLHAAFFLIWDNVSAYSLISSIDSDYRKYGAASLLVKEMITYASSVTQKFDFEGSMIETVERSFRKFGGQPKPYYYITRISSKTLRLMRALKQIIIL